MLIAYFFCRKINFTIYEVLSILEDDPPQQPTDIALFPPDDLGNVSDEDSASKNDSMKNVNQLGKELLSQKGELVLHYNEDKVDENDFYGNQETYGVVGVAADPQPEPSSANPLRSNTRKRKEGCSTQRSGTRPIWGVPHTVDKDAQQNKPAKRKFTESPIVAGRSKKIKGPSSKETRVLYIIS